LQENALLINITNSVIEYAETDKGLDKFNSLEKELLTEQSPNVWNINTDGNMEIKMEVEFKKFMFSIKEHTNIKVEKLTIFEFYTLLDYLKTKKNKDGRGNNPV